MAAQFPELSAKLMAFIREQQLYFVGTAPADGRINVSPKGGDTLRVLSPSQIAWLNIAGSGNETAAHLRVSSRMTMMFCSFEEQPMILRCYGEATALHPRDARWDDYVNCFRLTKAPASWCCSISIWCRPPAVLGCPSTTMRGSETI